MSEPVVTTELTRDPVPPDPALERDRKITDAIHLIEELEYDALVLQGQMRAAEAMRHAIAAKLTKAREALAKLVG